VRRQKTKGNLALAQPDNRRRVFPSRNPQLGANTLLGVLDALGSLNDLFHLVEKTAGKFEVECSNKKLTICVENVYLLLRTL
jgi:hypothetical protein